MAKRVILQNSGATYSTNVYTIVYTLTNICTVLKKSGHKCSVNMQILESLILLYLDFTFLLSQSKDNYLITILIIALSFQSFFKLKVLHLLVLKC